MTGNASPPNPSAPLADPAKPWISRVIVVMVIAILLYVVAVLVTGREKLEASLKSFPLNTYLPAILGLVLVGLFLRAARWHYYVRRLGWNVPTSESLLVFLASFAFTATPGKAGEVVKSGLLWTRHGVPLADSAGVLLTERLGDLLAVLILAIGGLTLMPNSGVYFAICLGLVVVLGLLITQEKLYTPLLNIIGNRSEKGRKIADKVGDLFRTGKSLLRPVPFAIGLAIATLAWSCEATAFFLVLKGFALDVPILTAFSIYGISTVVGALSMLPGGVGGVESAMALLLGTLNIKAAATVAPIVIIRFSTLWFGSLVGFVFLGVWYAVTAKKPGPTEAA